MKNRIRKTIITLLTVITMLIGIMPFASRKAEAATNQIVWDEDVISNINLYDIYNDSFSNGGITVTASAIIGIFQDSYIHLGDGNIAFSTSVGSITKIEILCDSTINFHDLGENTEWTKTGENGNVQLVWENGLHPWIWNSTKDFYLSINEIKKITFTVTIVDYNIEVSADPTEGGSVTGGGTYEKDSEATVTATANKNYAFVNWTENGNEVSTDSTYKFKVTGNRKLVANFVEQYPLWIGGNQVTSKYLSNETEGWSYDPDTRTLTLENANITGTYNHHCIHVERLSGTLTISLKGDNNVGNKDAYYDIYSMITELLITGDGSLTVSGAKDIGIQGSSLIKIKDTTVKISDVGDFGISSGAGLIIENSTVTVSSSDCGFNLGGVLITDSKVDVTGSDFGILVDDLYVSGDSYVSAGKTDSGSKAATVAIYAEKTFDIADLDIIEPEEGSIDIRTIDGHDVNTVIDKDNNIAQKAVIAKTYTITFQNDDGTVLQEKKTPVYETPKYEGNTPTKESDDKYNYTFKGWNKEITEVKGDATYTAVYDKTPIETPEPEPEPKPVTLFSIPKTGVE